MRRRVLTPHPGLSTGIGYYLSGMEEVRSQIVAIVKDIPDDVIGKPAFLGAHSIGGTCPAHRRGRMVLDADGCCRSSVHRGRRESSLLGHPGRR